MKHLPGVAFWVGLFGWLGVSTYLDHVKYTACEARGGTWTQAPGCDRDYCAVPK